MTAPEQKGRLGAIACKTPVPLAGLMLGLASAGNMVPDFKWIFGALSLTCLILLVFRIGYDAKNFRAELKNPAIAGIACTIPMGISILTTYTKPNLPDISYAIWIGAILVHIALMIYFTRAFMLKLDVKKILPCYFIVYVGIAIGAVVAPTYGAHQLGELLFWFGFISYLVLLPLIIYRTTVIKALAEPLLPTITIFAAPASLCLAGYLKSFQSKDLLLVSVLFALSLISYMAVLVLLPKMLKLKFYPSCSAFTFPMVISAIATNGTYTYLKSVGNDIPALQYLAWLEIALALVLLTFVLFRYSNHFLVKRGANSK
jgi:exfoliative toxin A/B